MDILRDYATSFVGTRYKWGGDNPLSGMDCSGLIQELLRSVGLDPPGDQTAQGLYDFFSERGDWNVYRCGALAFYGKSSKEVTHVAMLIDQYRVIEAAGGNQTTMTKEDAEVKGAFVRVRLIHARKDLLSVIRPHFITIGAI